VTRISRNLKAIAREFDVPIVALSQLNRSVELRDDKPPKHHDIRESGSIEQDADLVMGIWRELGTETVELDILKNRQGRVGRVTLSFDLERVAFRG
jgi:replicative DNA helicase